MDEEEKKNVIKEAKLLEKLWHPNIINVWEIYKAKKGKICIALEYAEGGDLNSKIND